jgi:hypothetical protein
MAEEKDKEIVYTCQFFEECWHWDTCRLAVKGGKIIMKDKPGCFREQQ